MPTSLAFPCVPLYPCPLNNYRQERVQVNILFAWLSFEIVRLPETEGPSLCSQPALARSTAQYSKEGEPRDKDIEGKGRSEKMYAYGGKTQLITSARQAAGKHMASAWQAGGKQALFLASCFFEVLGRGKTQAFSTNGRCAIPAQAPFV